jgi:hypothetical protein
LFTAALALLALGPAEPPASEPKSKPLTEQVTAYLTTEQWPEVFRVAWKEWPRLPKADQAKLVGLLVPALTDVRHVGLRNTEDLGIPYRFRTGDLKPQGRGFGVHQDLFTAGGRAAWAISRLLETDLPELNGGLTADEWAKRAAEIANRAERFQADARPDPKPKK